MIQLNKYFKDLFFKFKIKNDDNIVVHANLFTFGFNSRNLTKIVINNLKKAVGKKGTILMPMYTFGLKEDEVFDKRKIYKNNSTSLLSKQFFKTKVLRSNCPIHSHIGIGKNSKILLKSNPSNTYGKNSDFHLMKLKKFKLLLLGCSANEGATYLHQIEAMQNLNYGKWIFFKRKIVLNNKIKNIKVKFFEKKYKSNLNKAFNILSKKSKTFISIKNKYFKSSIIDLNELEDLSIQELKKNKYFFVKR